MAVAGEMGGEEQKFIQEAFDTNWVVPLGPNVNGFEADLEKYIDGKGRKVVASVRERQLFIWLWLCWAYNAMMK